MTKLLRFFREEEGVTAIEYGLIAALIAVVIIASVKLVGTNLSALFGDIAAEHIRRRNCGGVTWKTEASSSSLSHRPGEFPSPGRSRCRSMY